MAVKYKKNWISQPNNANWMPQKPLQLLRPLRLLLLLRNKETYESPSNTEKSSYYSTQSAPRDTLARWYGCQSSAGSACPTCQKIFSSDQRPFEKRGSQCDK